MYRTSPEGVGIARSNCWVSPASARSMKGRFIAYSSGPRTSLMCIPSISSGVRPKYSTYASFAMRLRRLESQ